MMIFKIFSKKVKKVTKKFCFWKKLLYICIVKRKNIMKVVKGKYIRLTEQELKNIISGEINKILTEYADPRNKVVEHVRTSLHPFVEHWCLVRYCTLVDRTQTKSHWKRELVNFMRIIGGFKLKGNNSYDARISAISQGEEGEELLSNTDQIDIFISGKFEKEEIDTNTKEFEQLKLDLVNSKDTLIDLFAKNDKNEIIEYVNSI